MINQKMRRRQLPDIFVRMLPQYRMDLRIYPRPKYINSFRVSIEVSMPAASIAFISDAKPIEFCQYHRTGNKMAFHQNGPGLQKEFVPVHPR